MNKIESIIFFFLLNVSASAYLQAQLPSV